MIPSLNGLSPGIEQSPSTRESAAASQVDPNNLANKEIFLQLLIAQIKNQDPSRPADSIQYLTQLSQFTSVEQLVAIRNQLKTLNDKIS
jgi:flagellar basal-body rod modification protein FlgD